MKGAPPRWAAASGVVLLSFNLLCCAGAGGSGTGEVAPPAEPYEVERTPVGSVETVRTVSGSLWGDPRPGAPGSTSGRRAPGCDGSRDAGIERSGSVVVSAARRRIRFAKRSSV